MVSTVRGDINALPVLDLRTALLVGALLVLALDLSGAFHGDQAVGAGVERTEGVAALLGGALVVLALDLVRARHGDEAVRAVDRVAELHLGVRVLLLLLFWTFGRTQCGARPCMARYMM